MPSLSGAYNYAQQRSGGEQYVIWSLFMTPWSTRALVSLQKQEILIITLKVKLTTPTDSCAAEQVTLLKNIKMSPD